MHARLFEKYRLQIDRPGQERLLEALYAAMEPANFSKAILEGAENLAVVPVSGTGWSDWGTPERVLRSLRTRHCDSVMRLSRGSAR